MSAPGKGSALAALVADQGTGEAHTPGVAEDADLFAAFEGELDGVQGAIAPPKRGPGRPAGSPNRTTLQLQKLLMARGYRDPAEFLAALVSADPRKLTEELGLTRYSIDGKVIAPGADVQETVKMQIRAAEALLPYFHQKMPIAVAHTGDGARPVIIIHGGPDAAFPSTRRDGAMSIHDVEGNQQLVPREANWSHGARSHESAQPADAPAKSED